jgi:hypothetical protein
MDHRRAGHFSFYPAIFILPLVFGHALIAGKILPVILRAYQFAAGQHEARSAAVSAFSFFTFADPRGAEVFAAHFLVSFENDGFHELGPSGQGEEGGY